MVERKKVKKKWCPTILKYNLLIYLVLVLKKKDACEVKLCRSNFIFCDVSESATLLQQTLNNLLYC